jgi:hypothetical protein
VWRATRARSPRLGDEGPRAHDIREALALQGRDFHQSRCFDVVDPADPAIPSISISISQTNP